MTSSNDGLMTVLPVEALSGAFPTVAQAETRKANNGNTVIATSVCLEKGMKSKPTDGVVLIMIE